MKNPAKVQHILITQAEADFLDWEQGGTEQFTCQIHFLLGMIGLHGYSGRLLKAGCHMLITQMKTVFQQGGGKGFLHMFPQKTADLAGKRVCFGETGIDMEGTFGKCLK